MIFCSKIVTFGLKWVEPIITPPDKVFERPGLYTPVTGQKFLWKILKSGSSILTCCDLHCHICQIFMRMAGWEDRHFRKKPKFWDQDLVLFVNTNFQFNLKKWRKVNPKQGAHAMVTDWITEQHATCKAAAKCAAQKCQQLNLLHYPVWVKMTEINVDFKPNWCKQMLESKWPQAKWSKSISAHAPPLMTWWRQRAWQLALASKIKTARM